MQAYGSYVEPCGAKGVAADTLLTTQCNTKVQTLLMLVGASRLCGCSPAISECAGMGLMGDG